MSSKQLCPYCQKLRTIEKLPQCIAKCGSKLFGGKIATPQMSSTIIAENNRNETLKNGQCMINDSTIIIGSDNDDEKENQPPLKKKGTQIKSKIDSPFVNNLFEKMDISMDSSSIIETEKESKKSQNKSSITVNFDTFLSKESSEPDSNKNMKDDSNDVLNFNLLPDYAHVKYRDGLTIQQKFKKMVNIWNNIDQSNNAGY